MSTKKSLALFMGLLPVVTNAFLPVCILMGYLLGCEFSLFNYTLFAVLNLLISAISVVAVFLKKELFRGKVFFCLFGISIPICFVNWLCYLIKSDSVIPVVCLLISLVYAVAVNIKISKFKVSKIILSVLTPLIIVALIFVSFIYMLLGNSGVSTVIMDIPSPNSRYYAQVIDVDQGAFGGNTTVDVFENRGIDLFVCKFSDIPERVYIGEWGEYNDMDIYWKNNTCLIINSTEYELGRDGIIGAFEDFVYEPLCEEFSIPDFSDSGNPVYTPAGDHLPRKFHATIFSIDEYMHWVYKLNETEQKEILSDIENGNWSLMDENIYYRIKAFDGFYGGSKILSNSLLNHECYVCVYDPNQEKIMTNDADYFCDDDSVYHANWVIFLYDTETFKYYCIYATM